MVSPEPGAMDPVLETLALLRSGVLVGLETAGADVRLEVELPEVAERLAPGSRRIGLTLLGCTRLSLEPFEAPAVPIDDRERLAAMRLRLLGAFFPAGSAPGIHALVTGTRQEPEVHGGLLRVEAGEIRLSDQHGVPLAPDRLARAVAAWTQQTLRTRSLAGHRKSLNALLKGEVAPLLAAHGFRTTGKAFVRADAEVAQLLEVEISRFSSALSLSFWVHAQVFLGDFRGEKKLNRDALLLAAHPVWTTRIGALWGNENEAYTFSGEAELDAVAERLLRDLAGRVLPLLQRLRTTAGVIAFLEELDRASRCPRSAFGLASALARAGRLEESKPYFRRCMCEDAIANEALLKIARSLGVEL